MLASGSYGPGRGERDCKKICSLDSPYPVAGFFAVLGAFAILPVRRVR
jgi:hypothetical protein